MIIRGIFTNTKLSPTRMNYLRIDTDIVIMVKICIGIKSFLLMNATVLF